MNEATNEDLAEARAKAYKDIERFGRGKRCTVFNDGLGSFGVGKSLTDPNSRGNAMQREYDRIVFSDAL